MRPSLPSARSACTILLSALLLTACSGSDAVAPVEPSLSGTYGLTAVNGTALPATIQVGSGSSAYNVTFNSGSLTFDAPNVTSLIQLRIARLDGSDENTVNASRAGTYTRSGSQLTIEFPAAGQTPAATVVATIDGDQITLPQTIQNGDQTIDLALVYRKP